MLIYPAPMKKPPMLPSEVLRSIPAKSRGITLIGIVHLEFDWVRCVLQLDNFFHLQLDISVDLIVGEHIALRQVRTIRIE